MNNSKLIKILVALLVLAIIFWAGTMIGYRKAEFSYRFSDNYFRNFGMNSRTPGGMMGIPNPDDLIGGHGATGKVVSLNLPNMIVSDSNNTEKNILITNETLIRSARSTVASTSIKADDFVVVIGTPNDNGTITANLIRIMFPNALNMSSTTLPYGFKTGRGPGMMYNR